MRSAHGLLLAGALILCASTVAVGAEEQAVVVQGYDGQVMEPFVSRDGEWLLFNQENEPAERTDLHLAHRIDDLTFAYDGPVHAANSKLLDAVPSVDADGWLYFVSTRAYLEHFGTVFRVRLGTDDRPHLVEGLARGPGWVHFDAEISRDGQRLYLSEGYFDGPGIPSSADLLLAHRTAGGFAVDRNSTVLAPLNTPALEYAAAVSADELILFFSRWDPSSSEPPGIWAAHRDSTSAPFGAPERLDIDGFVEAVTVADDGRIYYHRRTDSGFTLFSRSSGTD